MTNWRAGGLALVALVAAPGSAGAENVFAKPAVKLLLQALGASSDDAATLIALVERHSRTGVSELSPTAKRIATSAEAEYLKRCPPKNPWEIFRRRPDPPPGASDREVTCAFLHNLHVDIIKSELKLPK